MSFGEPKLLALELFCILAGIGIATCGGLLALRADVDRPLQCIAVLFVAVAVFLGGMSLLCWFPTLAVEMADRMFPTPPVEVEEEDEEPPAETALFSPTVNRSLPC